MSSNPNDNISSEKEQINTTSVGGEITFDSTAAPKPEACLHGEEPHSRHGDVIESHVTDGTKQSIRSNEESYFSHESNITSARVSAKPTVGGGKSCDIIGETVTPQLVTNANSDVSIISVEMSACTPGRQVFTHVHQHVKSSSKSS